MTSKFCNTYEKNTHIILLKKFYFCGFPFEVIIGFTLTTPCPFLFFLECFAFFLLTSSNASLSGILFLIRNIIFNINTN